MFRKVKTEHHILDEFHKFLTKFELDPRIKRIIPGRVHRKQKKSSIVRLSFSYPTDSGLKFKMSKGSTSQELFVICDASEGEAVVAHAQEVFKAVFKKQK